jgi:FkbM family methyltransferase
MDRVGEAGIVFAFEPNSENISVLESEFAKAGNIVVVPMALGATTEKVSLVVGDDPMRGRSRIAAGAPHDRVEMVQVTTGEQLLADGKVRPPAVIKIDTEGFELDVLRGLGKILDFPEVRAIAVEIHFALLEGRGMADAPQQIENLLHSKGFTVKWTGASHIIATR